MSGGGGVVITKDTPMPDFYDALRDFSAALGAEYQVNPLGAAGAVAGLYATWGVAPTSQTPPDESALSRRREKALVFAIDAHSRAGVMGPIRETALEFEAILSGGAAKDGAGQ